VPDSSGEDLRGGVEFPTGGIARDPVVVRGRAQPFAMSQGAIPKAAQVDSVKLRGRQLQSGWKKGHHTKVSYTDPKAYAFGFFVTKRPRRGHPASHR
jgi:hypothetical protein